MDFAGTGLLCGHGRMRGRHDLEVGQFVPEESPKPPLPLDVQMQIDLVDQEKSPCRQGIGIVVESRRRAIEQIADPRRHVLVAVAQVIQRHGSVDRVEDQRLARLVDVSERNVRKKLGEGRPNQLRESSRLSRNADPLPTMRVGGASRRRRTRFGPCRLGWTVARPRAMPARPRRRDAP